MNISQVEKETGMTRANIRFYEEQGLISPARLKNGYRDYGREDVRALLRVKLLRGLDVPIEDIRALQNGEKKLPDALDTRARALDGQQKKLARAADIVRAMQRDEVTYDTLDADKYLRFSPETARGEGLIPLSRDQAPRAYCPWRRFFAYMLDSSLCALLWSVFLAACHVNLVARGSVARLLDGVMAALLLLLLEPLCLRFLGYTPGKWLMGLKISAPGGGRLPYRAGLARAWSRLVSGLGLEVPGYGLWRLYKSYKTCADNEELPWDEAVSYTLRDEKGGRGGAYVLAALAVFALGYVAVSASVLPPCRGEITVAQFARNYNFAAQSLGLDMSYALDAAGEWEKLGLEGDVTIEMGANVSRPDFTYDVDAAGHVTGVRYTHSLKGDQGWLGDPRVPMLTAAYALMGAQPSARALPPFTYELANAFEDAAITDFSFTLNGVTLTCRASHPGYTDYGTWLIPDEGARTHAFDLSFSLSKE